MDQEIGFNVAPVLLLLALYPLAFA